jgi:hypothetical protein
VIEAFEECESGSGQLLEQGRVVPTHVQTGSGRRAVQRVGCEERVAA